MIAFDASDPLQLRYAKRVADEALASNRGAVLMTTRIDRARGFDAFGEYSSSLFPHRLYLLDSVVATRFGILHIPTIVQASGRLFQVDEIDVKELQQ